VRRASPRPLSAALAELSATLAPTTTLARVQAIWAQTAGQAIADAAPERRARRRGHPRAALPDRLRTPATAPAPVVRGSPAQNVVSPAFCRDLGPLKTLFEDPFVLS
jgi:hypothetical protein